MYCLAVEDGADRLSLSFGKNYHSTLRRITEERKSRLHRGRSLKLLKVILGKAMKACGEVEV